MSGEEKDDFESSDFEVLDASEAADVRLRAKIKTSERCFPLFLLFFFSLSTTPSNFHFTLIFYTISPRQTSNLSPPRHARHARKQFDPSTPQGREESRTTDVTEAEPQATTPASSSSSTPASASSAVFSEDDAPSSRPPPPLARPAALAPSSALAALLRSLASRALDLAARCLSSITKISRDAQQKLRAAAGAAAAQAAVATRAGGRTVLEARSLSSRALATVGGFLEAKDLVSLVLAGVAVVSLCRLASATERQARALEAAGAAGAGRARGAAAAVATAPATMKATTAAAAPAKAAHAPCPASAPVPAAVAPVRTVCVLEPALARSLPPAARFDLMLRRGVLSALVAVGGGGGAGGNGGSSSSSAAAAAAPDGLARF